MTRRERNRKRAEEWEERGWEALGFPEPGVNADLPLAEHYFRKALEIDPDVVDAYNGLGISHYLHGRYAEAEAMYRTALEKARSELGSERVGDFAWWGDVATRPYMRARHNLGLAFWRQGKLRDAIHEFEELLKRNPNDNQGVRYLIGSMHHLLGEIREAISYYGKAAGDWPHTDDPGTEFNHALALFQIKKYDEAVLRFRCSFFLNLYLPQVVLSNSVQPLDIWHGCNLAQPQYAVDYWKNHEQLWKKRASAFTFLGSVYRNGIVQCDLQEFVEIRQRLSGEKDMKAREFLIKEEQRLTNWDRLRETNSTILPDVLSAVRRMSQR